MAAPFLWLRRFYACGVSWATPVSMADAVSKFLALLFLWLTPFLCFGLEG
jgi:hypothetical protein